jgi:hypothetical protein
LVTQNRQPKPKSDKVRMVADDVVTANSLAAYLGMTRQNLARLTAEAVIERPMVALLLNLLRLSIWRAVQTDSIDGDLGAL